MTGDRSDAFRSRGFRLSRRLQARLFMLILVTVAAGHDRLHAGYLTATLRAQPSYLFEGRSSTLSLSLTHTPIDYGRAYTITADGGYTRYYFYDGSGQINSFSGTLSPSNGELPLGISTTVGSNAYTVSRTVQYVEPGTHTASFNGMATLRDFLDYDLYLRTYVFPFGYTYRYLGTFNDGGVDTAVAINASTTVHVFDLNPTITSITWDPVVMIGEPFSFSAEAYDPAGVAQNEIITFSYDFDADGGYDDLIQSGALTSSGTHSFSSAGIHTVRIRVTDGQGGATFGSFNVTALSPAPEPSSLSLVALGGIGVLIRHLGRRLAVYRRHAPCALIAPTNSVEGPLTPLHFPNHRS